MEPSVWTSRVLTQVVPLTQQLKEPEQLAGVHVVMEVLHLSRAVSHTQPFSFVIPLKGVQVQHTREDLKLNFYLKGKFAHNFVKTLL